MIVVKWWSRPINTANGRQFVMRSGDGSVYRDGAIRIGPIFPYPAFERLQEVSAPFLSSLFAHKSPEA